MSLKLEKVDIDEKRIQSTITTTIHSQVFPVLKKQTPSYFAEESQKKKKEFENLKKKILSFSLGEERKVQNYFQAYEIILDVRQFFLGEKGTIDYTILFSTKGRGKEGEASIHEITIDRKTFSELMLSKDGEKFLKESGGNIRFTRAFVSKLKQMANNIEAQDGFSFKITDNNFKVVNEIIGKSRDYKGADLFKKQIERQTKLKEGNRYIFEINLEKVTSTKDEKDILSYKIKGVNGGDDSQSIFSAIGKYTADEIEAKNSIINEGGFNTQVYIPNRGNLSEIYSLAKMKLNNDKNKFGSNGEKRFVSGQNLFPIYAQVLGNIDPFYSGGDILSTQIKSFLGSCPSLTSFSTIEETLKSFQKILSKDNLDDIYIDLQKKLIKKENENAILKEENELSKELTEKLIETIEMLKS